MITIKDANGNFVLIEEEEIAKVQKIFGMTMHEVGLLRRFYMANGDAFPVTIDEIKKVMM